MQVMDLLFDSYRSSLISFSNIFTSYSENLRVEKK